MPRVGQSVFIRADLNVPLKQGQIRDDFKLQMFVPTIKKAQKTHQKIIIATHQSRPNNFDSDLSTLAHAQWLSKNGIQVVHIPLEQTFAQHPDEGIYMIENLRFFPGEQAKEQNEKYCFSQQLYTLAKQYFFDAIATVHRDDSSVAVLPCLFTVNDKSVSQHAQKEYKLFEQLRSQQSDMLLIVGGIKAKTKLSYVADLVCDGFTVLLCPPLSLAFFPQQAEALGWKLEKDWVACAQNVLHAIGTKNPKLIIPTEYSLVAPATAPNQQPFIGLEAIACNRIENYVSRYKSTLFNGLIGSIDKPNTLATTHALFRLLAKQQDKQIVFAGGDTIAAARQLHISESSVHFSTAGGAALAILANKPLPITKCLPLNTSDKEQSGTERR